MLQISDAILENGEVAHNLTFEHPTSCLLKKKVSDDEVFTLKLIKLK